MTAIICGPNGRVTASSLSRVDAKTVRNFQQFLQGEGTRCPICLHKAKKHALIQERRTFCLGKGCECTCSRGWVERWWAKRLEAKR